MPPTTPTVSALSVLAFVAELLLLWVLAVAGARLGDGIVGVLLGVELIGVLGVLWGRWLAPRASRRLPSRRRVPVKLALVTVAAGLLAVSGQPLRALAFAVLAGGIMVIAELRHAG